LKPRNGIEIDSDEDTGVEEYHSADFTQILRHVRQEGGEDFLDVIAYGLRQGTEPGDVAAADPDSFYDHEVEPYAIYDPPLHDLIGPDFYFIMTS
jgi:hypothetical protein